jgi:HlyD family secretion protein
MSTGKALVAAIGALALAGCTGGGERPLQGYIEGTYVYLSAESTGRLVERNAEAGKPAAEGEILFRLDDSNETQAVVAASARLDQAEAQLANIEKGKRIEEIAVIAAQLSEARTTFNAAEDDYRRALMLREKSVVAQSAVDDAKAKRDAAAAQADATERQLDVAKLPARPEEIIASERNVAAEKAALEQAKIALARRTVRAPAAGVVEETFFEPGELVAAGQPVVSLLPQGNKRIRFFVPERQLATVTIGDRIAIACDGCAAGLAAIVDFIATEAEFTPPIIYSKDSRDKLVYRVEARPEGDAAGLKVGQPLDIRLGGNGAPAS